MHAEVMEFVEKVCGDTRYPVVYDIGGRDINGSPRSVITHDIWVGVDLHPGPGVDVVTDVRDWHPRMAADLVLCLEVLEHCPEWEGVLDACSALVKPGGLLVVTCAAPPRAPHSGIDGGPVRQGEHYRNIEYDEMRDWFLGWDFEVQWHPDHGDLHARATKPRW